MATQKKEVIDKMKDNTVITMEGIEIYENRIFEFADLFIEEELRITPDNPDYQKIINKNFIQMIFYIRENIKKPEHDDIQLLDDLFDVFVKLCVKYGRLPTLECFSFLVGINRATFTDWANKEYRTTTGHSEAVKRWLDMCKSVLVDDLSNSNTASVNKLFVAKAAYQMREAAPLIEPTNNIGIPQQSREEIAARHAGYIGAAEPEKPEL